MGRERPALLGRASPRLETERGSSLSLSAELGSAEGRRAKRGGRPGVVIDPFPELQITGPLVVSGQG